MDTLDTDSTVCRERLKCGREASMRASSVDVPAGAVDVGIGASVAVGEVASVDAGVGAAVDLSAGTVAAST